jgi:hypothetical protein
MKTKITNTILLLFCLSCLLSCKDEKVYPEIIIPTRVSFSSKTFVIEKDRTGAMPITLILARPLEKDGTITIQQVTETTTAVNSEYTSDPAFVGGKITINLPQGTSTASFSITSLHNFDDNKVIDFKVVSGTGGAVVADADITTTVIMRGNTWVNPAINPSQTALDDFGNVNVGTASAAKSYTLSGLNLSGPVTVTASENFKVSIDNTTFSSSVNIDVNDKSAPIYVRFTPNTTKNQAITGTITHTLTGLANVVVALSGTEAGNVPYVPEVPLLNENFEYGATSDFLLRISSKWTAYSAEGAIPVTYIPNGMSFPKYAGSGIGGSVTIDHGSFSREDVTTPFAAKKSGIIYTSLMVNLSKAGDGDFFYATRDAAGGFFNRLYAKDDGSGKLSLGVGKNASAVYATNSYQYNTTYLVVIKYDFSAKISSMYIIDANLPDTEPVAPVAVSLATGTSPADLADIAIRQSDGVLSVNLDGIRVATTWKGVLGL